MTSGLCLRASAGKTTATTAQPPPPPRNAAALSPSFRHTELTPSGTGQNHPAEPGLSPKLRLDEPQRVFPALFFFFFSPSPNRCTQCSSSRAVGGGGREQKPFKVTYLRSTVASWSQRGQCVSLLFLGVVLFSSSGHLRYCSQKYLKSFFLLATEIKACKTVDRATVTCHATVFFFFYFLFYCINTHGKIHHLVHIHLCTRK